VRGVSLDCLKLFAETQYPFVVSTKSSLVASPKYFDLIKQCNCVVQFSVVCERYDKYEKGASTFSERIEAAKKISKHKRVIARVQPYLPSIFYDVMKSIERFANAGIYGATFESMKKKSKAEGMVRVGGDMVYPVNILKEHFSAFKDRLHSLGMKFYSAENRLRAMGDDLCCCGVDGMGFRTNTFNANHYLYDKKNFVPTDRMAKAPAYCFKSKRQDTIHGEFFTVNSFKDIMTWELGKSSVLNQLKPTDEYATQATRNNKHTAAP
jgi:hypothetical protein